LTTLDRGRGVPAIVSRPLQHALFDSLSRNAPLTLIVAAIGVVFLLALSPSFFVADSWLTLVSGREISEHGLPSTDRLTVVAAGTEWVDQQWLAQVLFYWLEQLGSLSLVAVVDVALVLGAFAAGAAAARWRGASLRATALIAPLALFAAPWSWQVRAQTFALPLFVAVLWLLVDGVRGARRRTLAVFPLLAVWANLHGSVVLGAVLAMLFGALELLGRRDGSLWRGPVFLLVSPLCVLASPYATDLPHYYRLMLIDPPFADVIREWQPSRPGGFTIVFYATAILALALVARHPRRLTLFELGTLAITLVGAVTAIRGITWFALAGLVVLPHALDGVWQPRRARRAANRFDRGVVVVSAATLAVAAVVTLVRPGGWLDDEWPPGLRDAVARATADPGVRVYPSDRHADWLLWELPHLRGRVAYDVRFELYSEAQLDRIVDYDSEAGPDWKRAADGYQVVVVDERSKPSHTSDLASEPGSRIVFRGGGATVVRRAG
jgi:hypothetical protein